MGPWSQKEYFHDPHETAEAAFLSPLCSHSGHQVKTMCICSPNNQEIEMRENNIKLRGKLSLDPKYLFPFS